MGISELETAVRLALPMVIVVYDDEAYGAEVHHFGPDGYPLETVRFPPADIAAHRARLWLHGGDGARRGRPRAGSGVARVWAGAADPDRRQGHLRPRLLVARGGVPRPLSDGGWGVAPAGVAYRRSQ